MIVAVVVLAIALAGSVSLNAWLTYGRVKAAEKEADARVGQVATEAECERTAYELEVEKTARQQAERTIVALEEVISEGINSAPNPDLARNDVHSRVLRSALRIAAARHAPDGLPAGPGADLPSGGPASGADAASVQPLDPADVLL